MAVNNVPKYPIKSFRVLARQAGHHLGDGGHQNFWTHAIVKARNVSFAGINLDNFRKALLYALEEYER